MPTGVLESALEHAADSFALQRIFQVIVHRIDIHRKLPLLLQVVKRIFKGGADVVGIQT